jgi:hypothetical protein
VTIVLFWALMMGWLTWHEVWPAWTAQKPPPERFDDLPALGSRRSQAGIFDKRNRRIGTAWTTHTRLGDTIRRDDCLWIERFPALPATRIEADSTFDAEGRLDEMRIRVDVAGHALPIELEGERFPRALAFKLQIGFQPPKTFKIPLAQASSIGDMFRPFAALRDLQVGQSWRMQIFNPLAAISGLGDTFLPLLVRVTGTETVVREGRTVEAYVVEAGGTRALVGAEGVVYQQTTELPIGGTVVIRDEPYDGEAARRVRARDLSNEGGQRDAP